MSSIFEKLRLKARKRVDDAVVSFEQLVRDIADGKDVAEPQVEKTLEASGRNVEALEAAVARLHRRREIEAQIVELPRLQDEMRRIKKEYRPKLERELAQEQKRIDGQLLKLDKQHGELYGRVVALMELQTELMGLLPAAERAALIAARSDEAVQSDALLRLKTELTLKLDAIRRVTAAIESLQQHPRGKDAHDSSPVGYSNEGQVQRMSTDLVNFERERDGLVDAIGRAEGELANTASRREGLEHAEVAGSVA